MDKKITLGQNKLKIIFSLISFIILIPLLLEESSKTNFYNTLFIFLINRTIDMVFEDNSYNGIIFFKVWKVANEWLGIFACSFAFCALSDNFLKALGEGETYLKLAIFMVAFSCILKDVVSLFIESLAEGRIENKIKKEILKQEGIWN